MIQHSFVRRSVRVLLVICGAFAAVLSLSVNDSLTPGGWQNTRYSGPGGAFLALAQGLVTMTAGAYMGWRIGWKVASGSKPDFYKEEIWKWLDVFVGALLAFSVWAANV